MGSVKFWVTWVATLVIGVLFVFNHNDISEVDLFILMNTTFLVLKSIIRGELD